MQLILSVFSGIDLLGKAFQLESFCVVSAGDLITGQDIRNFHAPKGRFDGIIGGSPCQDFSMARRTAPTGYGVLMLNEFRRVVMGTQPTWFLLENVPQVPDLVVEGYSVQRFNLNASECGLNQNRNRCFQFGSKAGLILEIQRDPKPSKTAPCAMASEGARVERRTWSAFCQLQGLPTDYDLSELHTAAKYRAVGNGVPIPMGRRVAQAVKVATESNNPLKMASCRVCACGCGRLLGSDVRMKCATPACRKRLQARRSAKRCV